MLAKLEKPYVVVMDGVTSSSSFLLVMKRVQHGYGGGDTQSEGVEVVRSRNNREQAVRYKEEDPKILRRHGTGNRQVIDITKTRIFGY